MPPGWLYPVRCSCGCVDYGEGNVVNGTSRGLGDTIAKVTRKFGIKPCGGCKKRQPKFNEWFPYE